MDPSPASSPAASPDAPDAPGAPGARGAAAAASASAPGASTPGPRLSTPPGLEAIGDGPHSMETIQAIKQALLEDVNSKVDSKVEELWLKGKQMLTQVQKRQQENTDRLSVEIGRCLEKQKTLEADNEQLKQTLLLLSHRLGALSHHLGGGAFGAAARAGASEGGAFCMATPGGLTSASTAASGRVGTPGTSQLSDHLLATPPTAGTVTGGAAGASEGGHAAAAAAAAEGAAPLGEVPLFPFPSALPPPTTPLSLVEALGAPAAPSSASGAPGLLPGTPGLLPGGGRGGDAGAGAAAPRAPGAPPPRALSLANSLPVGGGSAGGSGPLEVFSFTLRKADETELGLNVSHNDLEKVLCVEGIRADGAVDAWNRQCMGGAYPGKAVMVGDRIISVNNVSSDPAKMLEECKEKRLLRLTICRGEGSAPDLQIAVGQAPSAATKASGPAPAGDVAAAAAQAASAAASTLMRAEASEFVPRGAAAASAAGAEAAEAPAPS